MGCEQRLSNMPCQFIGQQAWKKKMLLWWRLREESGHKKSKQQNGVLAQEEETKEIKPNKSTYLPSDEHLSASFIFPSTYNL